MTPTEYKALPADLQRDVQLALALGYGWERVKVEDGLPAVLSGDAVFPYWKYWNPTRNRTIWAGLLEAFPISVIPWRTDIKSERAFEAFVHDCITAEIKLHNSLPHAVVDAVIKADPLGHLARAMKELG